MNCIVRLCGGFEWKVLGICWIEYLSLFLISVCFNDYFCCLLDFFNEDNKKIVYFIDF